MNWNPNWQSAIASIESAGSGNYGAVGPLTKKGNRAYGRYQVMDFNIPSWTKKYLGKELTPDQFLNSPEAQDAVFKGEFGSYVDKYGNPQDAASMWFTGRPASQGAGRSDVLGTTGADYVSKFNKALKDSGAISAGIASDTMTALGKQPKGILAPQATDDTESRTMTPQDEPRGLLGSLGIQKMEEGAAGETGQRFYERDTFKDTAATLAQGFAAMGSMPGLQKMASDVAAQRSEGRARNKTVEYLRKNGRGDLADMVEKGLIGGKEAATALMQKPDTGEVREIDGKLVRVMPDGTVTELYASDRPAELTADMREYNLAKEQGFTGSFIEFIQAQKGGGLQIRTNPDGTTEIIQGGPAATKLTEGQSKATGFFARSAKSNDIISGLEQEGTELRNMLSGAIPFGNYLRTPEGQQYDQAKRDFINAILRQESGAVIGPSEFASAELQYFPQPGDSPEVIAQKRANRETAVRALEVSSGPGAQAIEAPAASGGAADDPLGLRS